MRELHKTNTALPSKIKIIQRASIFLVIITSAGYLREMASSLQRIARHSPLAAYRSSLTPIWRQFASEALVEIKPGEIGMVSGIPDEHLRRRVFYFFSLCSQANIYYSLRSFRRKKNFILRNQFRASIADPLIPPFQIQGQQMVAEWIWRIHISGFKLIWDCCS